MASVNFLNILVTDTGYEDDINRGYSCCNIGYRSTAHDRRLCKLERYKHSNIERRLKSTLIGSKP